MPSNTKERYFPYSFNSDPGAVKGRLKQHLEHAKHREYIIAIVTGNKMTVRQISAKVHEYLHKR